MVRKSSPGGESYVERYAREKGPFLDGPPHVDYHDVNEMLGWFKRETFAVTKESELRMRDATAFVTAYARGEISPEEANERMARYDQRWSEALDGIPNPERMTDDRILKELDRRMDSYLRQERASESTEVKKAPPQSGAHTERERVRRQGDSRAERSDVDKGHIRTADEMLRWLKGEVYAVSREADLRVRDATAIAIDYATGKISPKEANDRFFLYDERWGDALRAVSTPQRMTDDQILEAVDEQAKRSRLRRLADSEKAPSR